MYWAVQHDLNRVFDGKQTLVMDLWADGCGRREGERDDVVGEPCAVFNPGCCEPAAEDTDDKPTHNLGTGKGGLPEGAKKG